MLEEFGPSLYLANGPVVSFYGFPYTTRMAIAHLPGNELWVWSPVRLTEELASSVEALGRVAHIVSPNKIHHLFLGDWVKRWPSARLYAPPGLARRRPDLDFHCKLEDQPHPAWANDIDQVVFRGSFLMDEVTFFHRPSSTAIIGDLVQRHPESTMVGWRGLLMRLDGLVGERGSTPLEWRLSFLSRRQARKARDRVLQWNAERLLVAHGDNSNTDATPILAEALRWM